MFIIIDGFQVQLIEYKFLWLTFYSRRKLRICPGYFIDKNGNKIVLENKIVKSIYRPKPNIMYYIYLHYYNKVFDVVFHNEANCYENHLRIASIYINKKRRVRPVMVYKATYNYFK